MRSNGEPIYISHRRWFSLLLSGIAFCESFFFLYFTISTAAGTNPSQILSQFIPNNLDSGFGTVFLDFVTFVPIPIGAFFFHRFTRSKRIEFYGSYARFFLGWTNKVRDIPYSQMQLGSLRTRVFRGGISYHFKLKFGELSKVNSSLLDIEDGRIKKLNQDLYSFLKVKIIDD